VLACHPQHPFAKLKTVKLKALNGQKFISFEPDIPTRKALDKVLKGQGVTVEHVMEFDNIETVKRAVELDCVAIVPETTIRQEVADQTLAAVPLEGNHFRPLGAIHRKTKVCPSHEAVHCFAQRANLIGPLWLGRVDMPATSARSEMRKPIRTSSQS